MEETIQSVLNQEYPNLEYMIFDGGSNDNSLEIIKKYESKLRFWISEKDNGQADAINKGLKRATGEWIAFLNSDDLYCPNTFSSLVSASIKNPDSRWIVGNTEIFGSNNTVYRIRSLDIKTHTKPFQWIIYDAESPQPSTFLHRDLVSSVGLFSSQLHYAFDTDYWFRAHLKGFKPLGINETWARFRFHEQSKTAASRIPFLEEHRKMLENPDLELSERDFKYINSALNQLEAQARVREALHTNNPQKELIKALKLSPKTITNRMFWGAVRRTLL